MTDDFSGTDTLRHRLLVAGTNEIGQYGIANFSLRRVAAACGTSCAAPYRHFKNKEAFILEILRYIEGQWELLCSQILSLYEGDIRKQLIEVCIAYIRFWVANPNYRIALAESEHTLAAGKPREDASVQAEIHVLVCAYCRLCGKEDAQEQKFCKIKAILYGMTAMLESGELPNDPKSFSIIRDILEEEFQ